MPFAGWGACTGSGELAGKGSGSGETVTAGMGSVSETGAAESAGSGTGSLLFVEKKRTDRNTAAVMASAAIKNSMDGMKKVFFFTAAPVSFVMLETIAHKAFENNEHDLNHLHKYINNLHNHNRNDVTQNVLYASR